MCCKIYTDSYHLKHILEMSAPVSIISKVAHSTYIDTILDYHPLHCIDMTYLILDNDSIIVCDF